MAFVTLFVPEEFLNIPTHGSIQYHPSLLPAYRGASRDQLADHQGREGNRPVDLLAGQRPRYRRRADPEEDADLRHRHARHRLFRPAVPDGRRGHDGIGRPGEGRQGAAHQAGRVEGDLRRPLRPRQRADRLGQAVGADRPADPRLQSGARRLVHARRQAAQDFRRQAAARRRTRRASPARSARSPRSKPTASPWSAPTAASRSPACSPPTARRSTPANGRSPPTSQSRRGSLTLTSPRHSGHVPGAPGMTNS